MNESSGNWLISQEFKWRSVASAIWSFLVGIALVAAFLLVWIFSPIQHIFVLYDYFLLINSAWTWIFIISGSILIMFYIQFIVSVFKVTCSLPTNRFEMWLVALHPQNLFLMMCHGILAATVTNLVVNITESQFSSISLLCSQPGTTAKVLFLNESWFMLMSFSFLVGASHFISSQNNSKYSLHFTAVQPGRLLALKCHFFDALQPSMKTSQCYLQYYLLAYYCVGFVVRDVFSVLLGYPISYCYLMSIWNISEVFTIIWSLWIVGVFIIIVHSLTWDLFNIYQTKMQPFLIDSVFPEDSHKLLGACLNENQPLLVQHWAFQYLHHISSYSAQKRKQLFSVVYEGNKIKVLKWDIIADECLSRINNLTERLKDYQLKLSGNGVTIKTTKTLTNSDLTNKSLSQSQEDYFSVSALRRRPLHSDMTGSPNISCFQMSSLNATTNLNTPPNLNSTNLNSSLLPNSSNNSRTLHVPTPKLWNKKKIFSNYNTSNQTYLSQGTPSNLTYAVQDRDIELKTFNGQLRKLANKISTYFKQLSFVSFFIKKLPDREAANLFSDHYIHKWAIQSISLLSSSSLKEDEFGVVQRRLKEIVTSLLDLLIVLEKNCKLSITNTTSSPALNLLRHQHSLKTCTKGAIYRITNTFSGQLSSIQVNQEYNRRLKSFAENRE